MSLTTFIMDISAHSVTCFASTPAGCSRYFNWTLPIRANAESKKKKTTLNKHAACTYKGAVNEEG